MTIPSPSPALREFLDRSQEGSPLQSLQRADAAYSRLKSPSRRDDKNNFPHLVSKVDRVLHDRTTEGPEFDVTVAGGTLGIFHALALLRRGWRVALVERGPLKGRSQEWNISRTELNALLRENILNSTQLEQVIVTECHKPGRIQFAGRKGARSPILVSDVLNVGVAPDLLIHIASKAFIEAGGVVFQFSSVREVKVGVDGVALTLCKQRFGDGVGALGAGGNGLPGEDTAEISHITSRLVVDAMGSFSPIVQQARRGRKPDGVCVVVGSCLKGQWPENESTDIIYSFQPISQERSTQYFWEAFPVGRDNECRTTYMFAYGPCDERRHSLTETLEDYLKTLPAYQGVNVEQMMVKRVLFGAFPSYYKTSPTEVTWDRILPVGDAGGLQSPISFGGFGCCMRHLTRITNALDDALQVKDDSLLKRNQLQNLQWYSPALSVTGLFNRAMSVQPGQKTAGPWLDDYGINDVLWSNMKAMAALGEQIQRPFLQDVVTAGGLSKTLAAMAFRNPILVIQMTAFLGLKELLEWSPHYIALVSFGTVWPVLQLLQRAATATKMLSCEQQFWLDRAVEGVKYGSGADFDFHDHP